LFEGKTAHLSYYLEKKKRDWKQEKDQHEQILVDAERANHFKLLLKGIRREVDLVCADSKYQIL
jgi:phosphopantetheine adenylyltransferase